MEVPKNFFESICRVCLTSANNQTMVSLLDTSKNDLSCYGKAVVIFTNITIKIDSLPHYMCQRCLFLLKQGIVFKKMCEESHEKLLNLTEKCIDPESEIEQKLTEYVIFKDYFPDGCEEEASKLSNLNVTVTKLEKNGDIIVSKQEIVEIEIEPDSYFHPESPEDNVPDHDLGSDTTATMDEFSIDQTLNNIEKLIQNQPKRPYSNPQYYINRKQKKKSTKFQRKQVQNKNSNAPQGSKKTKYKPKSGPIQCKICNKVLSSNITYNYHMQYHTGNFKYVCDQCGKGFPILAVMQAHQANVHGVGRFFTCKQCGFKTGTRYQLMEHERLHTGERPYSCEICGLTFRKRFNWRVHVKYHGEKTVQCPKCPKKFTQNGDLMGHYNNVHERYLMYKCSECEVTYTKPVTVRRHMTEQHGIPREQQGQITKIHITKPTLKDGPSTDSAERLHRDIRLRAILGDS